MYRLEYAINGIKATAKNADPKKLRELIKQIETSKGNVEWRFYNCGGVLLDSSDERE